MNYNIATILESIADLDPNREAVIAGNKRLTFKELDERANRVAHSLEKAGIGAGDHVGLYLYNCVEFLEVLVGTLKVRAVPININYRYVEDELVYLFTDADLKCVVFNREFATRLHETAPRTPKVIRYIYVEDGADGSVDGLPNCGEYEATLKDSSMARGFPERSSNDLFIVYTGGTTGMPKGVMWRHEDLFYAGLQGGNPGGEHHETPDLVAKTIAAGEALGMTFLPAAPFIHGAAQWTALIGWFGGCKIIVVPGKSFEPEKVAKAIQDENATTVTLVGDAMIRPFTDVVKTGKYDLSCLMVVVSAGAILSESVKNELQEVLPEAMILNNFGATETGHQGASFESGENGRPIFSMDESNGVIDSEMMFVEPGSSKSGNLARSGRLPIGYYNDPEKTAKTFVELDGKRWFISGDIAKVSEDGMIEVLGRGAVCINTGGEKVYPEEVEQALKECPDVMDVLVVGIDDEKWGQKVTAVIQPRAGKVLNSEHVIEFCRKKVANYKVPKHVSFVDSISRHPSGKPDYLWAKTIAETELG
ncbi:MAG: acyl-CoA synthetase [Myxococcota bacterium]|nr:acyl-CoA synthetase [Myxococcota bacterium]